jgi:hypothetical protein
VRVQIGINRDACHVTPPSKLPHKNSNAMWQDSTTYGASSSQNNYYGRGNQPNVPLQFYDQSSFYPGSRSSLEGNVAAQGPIVQSGTSGYTGSIQPAGGWWIAFGTGGFEGEPPLLEGACAVVMTLVRCLTMHRPSFPQNSGLTSPT